MVPVSLAELRRITDAAGDARVRAVLRTAVAEIEHLRKDNATGHAMLAAMDEYFNSMRALMQVFAADTQTQPTALGIAEAMASLLGSFGEMNARFGASLKQAAG